MQLRGQSSSIWVDQETVREMFENTAKSFEKDRLQRLERSLNESWRETIQNSSDFVEGVWRREARNRFIHDNQISPSEKNRLWRWEMSLHKSWREATQTAPNILDTMSQLAGRGIIETEKGSITDLSQVGRQLHIVAEAIWFHLSPNTSSESEIELPTVWQQAITDSEKILSLEEDWDEMGGSAYDRSTWERAIDFLKTNVKGLWTSKQAWLGVPYIEPGPDGSIDLHWRTKSRELLVNIPADVTQPASYFGDELGENCIKGHLDTAEYQEWMMLWLIK